MSKKSAAIVVLFVFLFGLTVSLFKTDKATKKDDYQYLTGNILKIVKKSGVDKTIDRLDEDFKLGLIDINQCHSLLHTVGHAAYEFYPDKIVSLKNNICSYGFQHGVEAQIVLQKSYDTQVMADELHIFCQKLEKQYSGIECYHGAGHAFIQQGYKIDKALKACDGIATGSQKPEDCYRGAFSEYVNRLRGIDGDTDAPLVGVTPVVLDKTNVFKECLALEIKYQNACVSQFTSFLENPSDISIPLSDCNYYSSWVANTCAFKVTGAYVSSRIDTLAGTKIPSNFKELSFEVKKGYIYGMVNQYQQKSGEDSLILAKSWCQSLPDSVSQNYCISNLWN